ncbi:MAG: bifunctional [glutamine synthetase] adenylyltransferase/[glutamine synthetase]-adenylyl-L-tyrosine phosphorylase [Pseudomonadota bacterium]
MSERIAQILAVSPHLTDFARLVHGNVAANDLPLLNADAELQQATASLNEQWSRDADIDEADCMRALRLARRRAALAIALSDRAGGASVDETVARLSRFADAAISSALGAAFQLEGRGGRWTGDPQAISGFTVIGMGKLGAGELNYSSDIDLILLFDPETLNRETSERVEAGTFAVRVARRLVRLLQERTADGYVFRTDLRLRPDPASTPLALSIDGALNYYESQGRTWERAAMIKARCVAGDAALGQRFITALHPFIWRRHLDYAAIDAIRTIKRRINAHKGFGAITVPGHDVKLGRGGIREIEFFAQTQQLISGGRRPELRVMQTKDALRGLADAGWIEPDERDELCAGYDHLRQVEHCIQMIRDEQTHRLGQEDGERRAVAVLMDEELSTFDARVGQTLQTVHAHFQDLFPDDRDDAIDVFDDEFTDTLAMHLNASGFASAKDAHRLLLGWMRGTMNATATSLARDRLREIGPALLRSFGQTDNPDAALRALDDFLRGLQGGVQFFSMLASNPKIMELLARIMGTAPRLASTLARRARLFDALLDPRFFGSLPSRDAIRSDLRRALCEAPTYEAKLNASRVVGQEHHFLIGVRLLSQTLTADEAAAAYTALAEEIVLALLDLAWDDVRVAHGDFPGASLCVLAMGKLGSRELTASSDLDLLLIYDLPEDQRESDGQRPLAPSHYFTRLTQRLIAALSAPTSEGVLYELDMRLRPSGNAGPLATSLTSFERYQRQSARTWEHMALTRARAIGDGGEGCRKLDAVVAEVLTTAIDPQVIKSDVASMRALIEQEKPAKGTYDLKLVTGGILDIEFVAQGLQLLHAARLPDILNQSTEGAIGALKAHGVLSPDDAAALSAAHDLYSTLSQILRLCLDDVFEPNTAAHSLRRLLADAVGLPTVDTLTTHLEHTQADVRARFDRLFVATQTPSDDAAERVHPSGATNSMEKNTW